MCLRWSVGRKSHQEDLPESWYQYNCLLVKGDLGGLEPRGTTKSHHATELTWEAYGGEVQGWLLSKSRRKEVERGEKGLAFIRTHTHTHTHIVHVHKESSLLGGYNVTSWLLLMKYPARSLRAGQSV